MTKLNSRTVDDEVSRAIEAYGLERMAEINNIDHYRYEAGNPGTKRMSVAILLRTRQRKGKLVLPKDA